MSRIVSWQGALATAFFLAINTPIHAAPQSSTTTDPPAPASAPTPSKPSTSKAVREAEAADEVVEKVLAAKQQAGFTYLKVIEAQKQALQAWLKTGMMDEINFRRIQLATSYYEGGDLRLSAQVIKEALQASRNPQSPTDYDMRASILSDASVIAEKAGDYRSAIAYLQEAISIFKLRENLSFVLHSNMLVMKFEELGDFAEAKKTLAASKQFLKTYRGGKPTDSAWHIVITTELGMLMSLGELNQAMLVIDEMNQRLASASAQSKEVEDNSHREIMEAMASVVRYFSSCAKPAKSSPAFSKPTSSTALDARSASSPSPRPAQRPPSALELIRSTGPFKINQTAQSQRPGYGRAEDIEKAKAEGRWFAEATMLGQEADEAYMHGDYKQAVILYQRALALARKRHAAPDEANSLKHLAEIAIDQGELQLGLQLLQQALSLQEALGLRPAQAKTLNSISQLYKSLGAKAESLGYAEKARLLAKSLSMSGEEISALRMIASIHKEQQRLPEAEQAFLQAMTIAERNGNCWEQSMISNQMANLFIDSGNLSDAAIHAAKADTIANSVLDDDFRAVGLALARRAKARILLKQGNPQAAAKEAEGALRLAKQFPNPQHQTSILTTLAEAHVAMGDPPKAIAIYQQLLDLLNTMDLAPEKAQTLYAIAQLQRRQGDRPAALATINQAIAIVETMRKQVVDPELRTSFFASKQDFYSFKIDLLLEWEQRQPGAGHAAEAFHTSERSRARTLLELLADARSDIRQGIAPDLREREKALQYRRTALDKRWQQAFSDKADPSLLPQLQQERQQLLQQTQELRQAIRASSPRYAALTDPSPLTLEQVQRQLLDPNTLLLQFALGAERSHLFVVGRDSFEVHPLPPISRLDSLVRSLRTPLTDPKSTNHAPSLITPHAVALSQEILGPAARAIRAHKRLIVVPDGSLHLVPFSTLPLNGQLLGESHQLIHLPSSSTLALIRSQPSPTRSPSIAILADPIFSSDDQRVSTRTSTPPASPSPSLASPTDLRALSFSRAAASLASTPGEPQRWPRLPFTLTEAQAIQKLFPAQQTMVALDEQANLRLAQDPKLARYSILHYATHGMVNTREPALSGLVLSLVDREGRPQDGFLQLADVFNLKLAADLVVLSACETGLGGQVKGEGLVGLTRGFLYAGTSRVLVSLWQVDDAATAAFMQHFYKALLQQRLPPSQALAEAQNHLRSQSEWASPYFWGAFVLQGEW